MLQTHRVSLPAGIEFDIVIDAAGQDDITQAYARGLGANVSSHLVSLMLHFIRPQDAVIDLGPFIGTFSLAAAGAGARVLAVEASPLSAGLLRASAVQNAFQTFHVAHAAVSDVPGSVEFFVDGPFGHIASGTSPSSGRVLSLRVSDLVDELGWEKIAFIKMDVEGSEIRAIRGMSDLLAAAEAPPILLESNAHTLSFFNSGPEDLYGELESLGYECYLVRGQSLHPVSSEEIQPVTVADVLAIKGPVPVIDGWTTERLNLDDRISVLVGESRLDSPIHRAYIARALSKESPGVVGDLRIAATIEMLAGDPSEVVRHDIAWWKKPGGPDEQ